MSQRIIVHSVADLVPTSNTEDTLISNPGQMGIALGTSAEVTMKTGIMLMRDQVIRVGRGQKLWAIANHSTAELTLNYINSEVVFEVLR